MGKNTLTFPFSHTHVNLTDYDYKRELEIRKQMANLSKKELEFLEEIVHQSLSLSTSSLAKHLKISLKELQELLDQWVKTKLFKQEGSNLIIDKEMRKFIEFQIEKFDENFEADLNYLKNSLNRFPLSILLEWYSIPRTSQEFFNSLINHFFINPSTYLQYLESLVFKNSTLQHLLKEISCMNQPFIYVKELKQKHHLSEEEIELYLLILEHHFVCCLSYRLTDTCWEEVVTPLKEWQEVLKYESYLQKSYLLSPIEKTYLSGPSFIEKLKFTLKKFKAKKGKQTEELKEELTQLEFIEDLHLTSKGEAWLSQSCQEQMMTLSCYFLDEPEFKKRFGDLWTVKNLRFIDSSLRRVEVNCWINFQLFLKSLTLSLGSREPLALKFKGTRWKYPFPVYSELEKEFIKVAILERLSRIGVIEVGEFQQHSCFRLTPLGSQYIS